MESATSHETESTLAGARIAFVGRLAGMNRKEATATVRRHGGQVQDRIDTKLDLIVVSDNELPLGDLFRNGVLTPEVRQAADQGSLAVITETQLWQRLGLVDAGRKLYTPAMLADLLDVSVAVVRRWHRTGLIVPAREVKRLPYFEFQEVATARRLAELLAAGCSPVEIERKLAELSRYVPAVDRPLSQLSVIVEGKHLLLRQGDGLVEPGGQLRIDFEASEQPAQADHSTTNGCIPLLPQSESAELTPGEMIAAAEAYEDEGQLEAAVEMYRAALAAAGPVAEVNFALAEVLYRLGDSTAARERYFSAIELDEDYVEARANLGCVLAETGQAELAIAAFQGALAHHDDYPDVHYHLARTLDELERAPEAENHWRVFLQLAPDSPWAEEAQHRLQQTDER